MTLNMVAGPPKISRKVAKKSKKNWRKNIDITAVEDALEEQRFEERIGGSFATKESKDFFVLDTGGETEEGTKKKKKKNKEIKPFKCFSLLEGLPGVPDPAPQRDRIKTADERMNPVVKKKKQLLESQGFVSQKDKVAKLNREKHLLAKKATELDRKTRRRTEFDFDLWGEENNQGAVAENKEKKGVDNSWIEKETKVHTDTWTSKHRPKEGLKRNQKSKTLLPAVEVPHPGQSYNPALADHQDILWKAAMVEIDKEKEQLRIERLTTGMFPKKSDAPNEETYFKEMAVGIPELGGEQPEDSDEDSHEKEGEKGEEGEEEKEKVDGATPFKPKTRKQKRNQVRRDKIQRINKGLKMEKLKEEGIFTLKSIKKEMNAREEETKARQKRKAEREIEKLKNPAQLSNYKYEPQEIEIKLSDELTGNLRNLKPEGSILEDRYKSMQRRNIVETRIKHHAKKAKVKIVDKKSHKMGFEDELRRQKNTRAQKARSRAKAARIKARKGVLSK
eukprot:TRINITY_DN614_c0_g1_i1.p1 TRINITY_DN614_c0_g1~~TRINITY_DN614_c0_g1_i1.p1  ORF type:complete len:505 (+),score=184.75 TRINITY_DN614_c0_g1_i1:52-1566(+)